jgi:sugar transferase (PEP-CTERM/EpsH1 system associated)
MSDRPVVVHVVHSLETGGLENGVVNLVNRDNGRVRHVIVCMTGAGSMRERIDPGVEVVSVGKRPGNDVRAFARLVSVFRRLDPGIVHSRNWPTVDAIAAARIAGVSRVVHSEHGREFSDPDGRNVRRNLARRLLAPLVSHFVTVSHDLRAWLLKDVGIPAHKVTTIHNGVDLDRFGAVERRAARDELGLPLEALVIGTIGRLDPVKDQAALVRALSGLRRCHPEACLVIAGDGPCRDALTRLSLELGVEDRVWLLGQRSDVPVVLAAMDVFALPSIAEGMSNTALEAMATGLPVVATRVGGSPELVADGLTGRLVPRGDERALREALAAYLEDSHLRDVHGKAARQRAAEQFGLDRMCKAYMDLYRRVMAGRAGRVA